MSDTHFNRSQYFFDLPDALIAATPLAERDQARLMVVDRANRSVKHLRVSDLPQILNSDYVLVANNTRVFKARLLGERLKTGGRVEFFLLRPVVNQDSEKHLWQGLMKTGARVEAGFQFQVPTAEGHLFAEVVERSETSAGAIFTAKFSSDPLTSGAGEVPLPPYITAKRLQAGKPAESENELEIYNTVFAKQVGSVAAPTAGRHFTQDLLAKLKAKGISWNELTLHVGMGTFKPVMADDIREHQMHAEPVTISAEVAKNLNEAKRSGKKILAVGTTTTRALEGAVKENEIPATTLDVNLFIHPGSKHKWSVVDAMLTNFHLPESTLLMMVASFLGDDLEWTLSLYQEAIREGYRFYSYGDAMLIL